MSQKDKSHHRHGTEMTLATHHSTADTAEVKQTENQATGAMAPSPFKKLLLLSTMVLQASCTVLIGRYTRSSVPKEDLYEVSHLILVCEVAKLLLNCCLELYAKDGKLCESLRTHVVQQPLDALKLSVPALLYFVQNSLFYVAMGNLTGPIYQVTYQCKLIATALVSVVMLRRRYELRQWICLIVLSLGVATVLMGERNRDEEEKHQNLVTGLSAVSVACLCSALAGVYFEKLVKRRDRGTPASLFMRNMQLAFFSIVIAGTRGGGSEGTGKPYLHGFSMWTWVLVGLQAGGGLVVSAVVKYADNVIKGLATGFSVLVGTALSTIVFGTPLTAHFTFGGILILGSAYVFSNPLPTPSMPKDAFCATKLGVLRRIALGVCIFASVRLVAVHLLRWEALRMGTFVSDDHFKLDNGTEVTGK